MTEPELLNRHEKGAWAETWAVAWLFERGFWVARNIAVQGPFDIIAVSKVAVPLETIAAFETFNNSYVWFFTPIIFVL